MRAANARSYWPRTRPNAPLCGGSDLSDEWSGIIIIMDTNAQLASAIGAKQTGRYAIKVR